MIGTMSEMPSYYWQELERRLRQLALVQVRALQEQLEKLQCLMPYNYNPTSPALGKAIEELNQTIEVIVSNYSRIREEIETIRKLVRSGEQW